MLSLRPLLERELIAARGIAVLGTSGASGASKGLAEHLHFCNLAGNSFPYKVGEHRHVPEIEHHKIAAAIPALRAALGGGHGHGPRGFARAILTTDTVTKVAHGELHFEGGKVRLFGVAKGSGMVHPNMATTLGFVCTDAAIAPELLHELLREAVEPSFNAITVDGDTSTNDSVLALASGESGVEIADPSTRERFAAALSALLLALAEQVARDLELMLSAELRVLVVVPDPEVLAGLRENFADGAYRLAEVPLDAPRISARLGRGQACALIQPRPDPGALVTLAVRLGLGKLLSLANDQGLRDAGGLVSQLSPEQALVGLDCGRFMTDADENLAFARHAARQGLGALHLIDGRLPHALVAELFTEQGVGTLISRQLGLEG